MEGNKDDKQQISQGNIVNNSTNSLSITIIISLFTKRFFRRQ